MNAHEVDEPGRHASRVESAGLVLIVDDEPANVTVMALMMRRLGHAVVTAADGAAALEAVAHQPPDVILLDVRMPRLDGFEVCRRLKGDPATRLIPVIMLTGLAAVEDRVQGIDAGADDFLSKPFVGAELRARVRSLMRLKRYTDELDSAAAVILSLGRAVEARDPYTQGHCERLAAYAGQLGAHLDLSADQQLALRRGGYLHDLGKVGIPDAILLKPGPLDPAEYAVMQQHPVIGDGICRELRMLADVTPIVRHHHERVDGTGYPDGLRGDAIPLLAQIMNVVDAYDAMTTDRPYKRAFTPARACDELQADAQAGARNVRIVEEFISIVVRRFA